jgi:uncharacterized protein (DUF305 family)
MALGEVEKKFMDDMIAQHQAAIVVAENYLKKSDNATRPADVVRMATSMISDHTYQIEEMQRRMDMMSGKNKSAQIVADRLMGREAY